MPGRKGKAGEGRTARNATIKVRLHPTPEQAEQMERTFGCCRYLWNQMLCDAEEFYAAADTHYIPTPARYKAQAPFLREVDSQALCAVHQNLRRAYLDFFRNPGAFGHPRLKTKKAGKDSFTVYCRPYHTGPSLRFTKSGVQMPKLGLIPARVYRMPQHWWSLRFVTVTRTKSGKYFCAATFGWEEKAPEPVTPSPARTVGLNYSLSHFYVDSQGNSPQPPPLARSKEKLSRMQQRLSRMEYGSRNYEEQIQKIRLLHEHIANQRRDFIHKESRRIANAWDAVCVRETDLVALSQKLRQANVSDAGFGMFRKCLQYKLERQGKRYIVVDRHAPAAKTCHVCGRLNGALDTHQRHWQCPACGAQISRAVNTARNLRDMGLGQLWGQDGQAKAVS